MFITRTWKNVAKILFENMMCLNFLMSVMTIGTYVRTQQDIHIKSATYKLIPTYL